MYNHKIVDTETGEEIIEPLSDLEAAKIDANFEETKKELAAAKVKKDATTQARNAAEAKLLELGITQADLVALGL